MLRELNENEMEMVSGGTDDPPPDPVDEIVVTGTRRTDDWVSVYPEDWLSVGMSAEEYIFGIQSGLIDIDSSILGLPIEIDVDASLSGSDTNPEVQVTGTATVTVVDTGTVTVTGTATGTVDTSGNTSGSAGVNVTVTF